MFSWLQFNFNKIYWTYSASMLALVVLRCYFIPFSHDEVATFYFYIQPESFLPFTSHVDANGHFLTNLTSWICYKLFGSSVFSLRLPNIFAFIVLVFGTFKLTKLVNGVFAKLILTFGFIACFNFISFYSLCRGYGLSMAFLITAFYYFYVNVKSFSNKNFILFLFNAHMALSANLTLVFVLLISSSILILFQIVYKHFFKFKVIGLWFASFTIVFFWIKYAFFLQSNGALYYGSGDSYWEVTFVSLIEIIFFKHIIINILTLVVSGMLLFYWLFALMQQKTRFLFNSQFAISFFILLIIILAFYMLKVLLKVNYPEDRTGLFFYVLFIIALGFKVSESRHAYQKFSLIFPSFVLLNLFFSVNLTVHPWRIYETFPARFLDKLVEEQKHSKQKITIAGHRLREFIFGFINYNHQNKLNHITSPEALQMNADYAIAYQQDKPYYENFYNEIDTEDTWGFVLLKRKQPIERTLFYKTKSSFQMQGDLEYYNTFEKMDTTFNYTEPLLAEFDLSFNNVPVPFNAWLTLQIDDAEGKENSLIRVPLNLIQKDWNAAQNKILHILSGNIPLKIKRIVCYLWNIDKQNIQIKVNSFKLYRLNGKGIQIISQAKI
jgi:hypothetical protein